MSSPYNQIVGTVRGLRGMLILFAILLPAVMFPLTHGTAQQEQERLLEKYNHRKEPLRIKSIKGGKGGINLGRKFLESDSWLKSLSFSLENISGKNITFINLELEFPRSDGRPPLVFPLTYGSWPPLDGSSPVEAVQPIRPGEEIVLSFSDSEYAALQQVLEEVKYPKTIKHAILDLRYVLFDDGLLWNIGRLMRQDPNNPRRWVPIDVGREGGASVQVGLGRVPHGRRVLKAA